MNNYKRQGFNSKRLLLNPYVMPPKEPFDAMFQFRPFKLYIITSLDDQYAITGEDATDSVYLSKPDPKNKKQWVFIDSDTGVICFFYDLKSYMQVEFMEGTINVKRGDILKEGTFNFKADNTIVFRNKPTYMLGFRPPNGVTASQSTPVADDKKQDQSTPVADDKKTDAPSEQKTSESFIGSLWESFTGFFGSTMMENFDPATEPALEAVSASTLEKEKDKYSVTWKYTEVLDLRNIADNADTVAELTKVDANKDTVVNSLNKIIETNKAMSDIEIKYRDDTIAEYEKNWFIKMFLAPKKQ